MHQNEPEGMHADEPPLAGTGISWFAGREARVRVLASLVASCSLSKQQSKVSDFLDRESREFASTLGSTSYVSSHSPLRFFKQILRSV